MRFLNMNDVSTLGEPAVAVSSSRTWQERCAWHNESRTVFVVLAAVQHPNSQKLTGSWT